MDYSPIETLTERLPELLRKARKARHISMRVLADQVGVNVSVVSRAEHGGGALLSTWAKLFSGIGYCLVIEAYEASEEGPEFIAEESNRRLVRRLDALYRRGRW